MHNRYIKFTTLYFYTHTTVVEILSRTVVQHKYTINLLFRNAKRDFLQQNCHTTQTY